MAQKKPGCAEYASGCGCLVLIIMVIAFLIGGCSAFLGRTSGSSSSDHPSRMTFTFVPVQTDAPTAKPRPTATPESYEHQRQREKHEFYETVDESISGPEIAGARFKYVGDNVDLHCTVSSIPDRTFFNANCGEDDNGLPATLVIETDDDSELSEGQSVRILGTVAEPMEGVNGFGGDTTFPTVKAEYIE